MKTTTEVTLKNLPSRISAVTVLASVVVLGLDTPGQESNPFQTKISGGSAQCLAVQGDGKVLWGGYSLLRRLNADGSEDLSFAPSTRIRVAQVVVQDDGKILASSRFISELQRFNPDGAADTNFQPALGSPPTISRVAVQPDGKILVAGIIRSSTPGVFPRELVRLNPDGSLDTTFNPDFHSMDRMSTKSLAIAADGKILAGVTMGTRDYRILRFNADGSLDRKFDLLPEAAVGLNTFPDGTCLVHLDRTFGPRLGARMRADGSFDPSFDSRPHRNTSAALQEDGKIVAIGDFALSGGYHTGLKLNRLNSDGSVDTSFEVGSYGYAQGPLALQADGNMIVPEVVPIAGQPSKDYLRRVQNPTPGVQALVLSESEIKWVRGGSSPTVWRTSFELSADGITWSSLGAGARLGEDWVISGVSLSPGTHVRARGYVDLTAGSQYGNQDPGFGSCWFVETTATVGELKIVTQPQNRTNQVGGSAIFGVSTAGTKPLSYQWRKDGLDMPGTTEATLALCNLKTTDAGQYSVIVSAAEGSVTSALAVLEVGVSPRITQHPLSYVSVPGSSAVLSVTAVGEPPFNYQWSKDGTEIPGATVRTFAITGLQLADVGTYRVSVCNAHGMELSEPSDVRLASQPLLSYSSTNLSLWIDNAQRCVIEVSTDSTQWQDLHTILVGVGRTNYYGWWHKYESNTPALFYRARLE